MGETDSATPKSLPTLVGKAWRGCLAPYSCSFHFVCMRRYVRAYNVEWWVWLTPTEQSSKIKSRKVR